MVPYLPPELIDCIISKLAAEDAIEALAACSLVSRVWNALAQPHQFRRLCYSFKRILSRSDSLLDVQNRLNRIFLNKIPRDRMDQVSKSLIRRTGHGTPSFTSSKALPTFPNLSTCSFSHYHATYNTQVL